MAFPQTVLPVRVRIAPGGSPAADPATWVWVDITSDVRVASGITITEGKSDEGQKADPGKCTLTLDNTTGDYSTRNVLGQWYGTLAKGTPLRVGTIATADTFTRTRASGWGPADSGQTWSHSATSQWSTNGTVGQYSVTAANTTNIALTSATELLDIDAQFTASVPAVMTGASMVVGFHCRYLSSTNNYFLTCEFNPAGTVTSKVFSTVAGVATQLATTGNIPGLTYTANQKLRVRVQTDGPALRTKIWVDGNAEPAAWNLNITDTSISTAGLAGYFMWCVAGNTNTKPFAVNIDDLEVEAIEFTGAVYEWPPRWDQSRKDATVPITASGILRRLQQGKSPLRDAITRMMLRQSPVELWPFTDNSQSTVVASALSGGRPATVSAVEFAQDTPVLPGAKQTIGITASTVASWQVRPHTATGTWAVVWFAQLLAPPAAPTVIMTVSTTGTIKRWDLLLDSGGYNLQGFDAAGTQLYNSAAVYDPIAKPPAWIAFDLLVTQSGGNVDAKILAYGVDPNNLGVAIFFGTTVAGTVGSPVGGRFQGSLGYNGGLIGPLAVFNFEPQFVGGEFTIAANGYIGEAAADRIARLCGEEGVQVVVEAGESEALGAQGTDTFLNLLYAAEDADMGILYERGAGLAYRPRSARYNRTVEFPLNFAIGDVAAPPEPTDDDQQLKNQWTISRDGGSSATAIDQNSVNASGLLDDSKTLNVEGDDRLPDQANWRLKTTTVDEYRWPSITLNLARNTGQIRLWRAARPFPRVTIANEPTQVLGNAVDVTVLGYSNALTPFGWDIDLNCAPSSPWSDVGVYGTDHYDSSYSTVATGFNAAATSIAITTGASVKHTWSTTAVPYVWVIAGEPITVTSITSPAGTGPWTQTATVTRGSIAKAHVAGEEIDLAAFKRYTL